MNVIRNRVLDRSGPSLIRLNSLVCTRNCIAALNRFPSCIFRPWLSVVLLTLAAPAFPVFGMTVYENEALRVEFLEVGKIATPNLDVPLRFKIENRGTVRIAGTLDIGGPTRGILPRNEPTKRFEVEKGSSIDLELQISFGENCVDGFYPVHAFFLFDEGRGDRAILTRLIRPDFAAKNRSATEDHRISVASFRPAAVENVVDRFFEEKRLAVMADYARSLDSGTGRAYRLSSEEGAYHLLFAPGRQGMLDGYFYFAGPKSDLYFRGLRVSMQGPEGVVVSGAIEVDEYREEKRENGFFASHKVRLGEWESTLNVEVTVGDGQVKIRCDSPEPVVEMSMGEVSRLPTGLTAGQGFHFANPDCFDIGGESPLLNARFVQFEFGDGLRLAMGCDEPLRAIRVIREENHASAVVSGRQWLRVAPCVDGGLWLPPARRPAPEKSTRSSDRCLPSIWLRRNGRDLEEVEREVKDWGRYETGLPGLILVGWQAGNPEPVPPDSWPPNEASGGTTGLSRLAEVCKEAGVTLVLADDYGEISPAARGFQFDAVEFGSDGRPVSRRKGTTYALRPDAALAYFEENWKQIQFHLKPGAAFVGGLPGVGHEFWDREGHLFPASWVRERWRANAVKIREAVGPAALILSGGGGDWLSGLVDAIVVPSPPHLPAPATRVPWWVLLHGGTAPLIEEFPEDSGDGATNLSQSVTDASLPLFGESTWFHEALRRSWLLSPIAQHLQGRKIVVAKADANRKQLFLDWGTGFRVWRNSSAEPWAVEHVVISPGGFWVDGPGLRGGIESLAGVPCERLETPEERSVIPDCLVVQPFPVRMTVENLTQLPDARVELALHWQLADLIPPGSSLRFYLSNPGERGKEKPWGDQGIKLGRSAPAKIVLPAAGVPPDQDWMVWMAIENPGKRRLPLWSGAGAGEDPGLVRVGRLRKLEGEISRWEAAWRTEQEWPGAADPPKSASLVDFGWGTSRGAFRLKKSGDRWRIYPLPGQREFDLLLRPAQIPGFLTEVAEVTAWPRNGEGTAKVLLRREEGSLAFRVEPDMLAYEFTGPGAPEMLKPATPAADPPKSEPAPAPPKPEQKP